MHLAGVAAQRQGHHRRAGRQLAPASGPVIGDLAAELVPEDDLLVGAHEPVVAGLDHEIGELVAVVARVEVRAADAAAQDLDRDLALCGLGVREVDDLKLRTFASDRPHRGELTG